MAAYLFIGAVIAILIAWSWRFHFWSNSHTAQRSRTPLSVAVSTTAASALFLVTGISGCNLNTQSRFFWTDGVIWWQVGIGLVLAPAAIYFWRLGIRDINRSIRQ